jgi:hypothetical protein
VIKRVIYTDAETAGVVQEEIDRQGLGDLLEVQSHPYVPVGTVIADNRAHPWRLIDDAYAGLRVLLPSRDHRA